MSRPVPLYATSSLDFKRSRRNDGSSELANNGRVVFRLAAVTPFAGCIAAKDGDGFGAATVGVGAEL